MKLSCEKYLLQSAINIAAQALYNAHEQEREIDRETSFIAYQYMTGQIDEYCYEETMRSLDDQKRSLQYFCKSTEKDINAMICVVWSLRNTTAGRSNTSSVSDKMLLTIPTPPTAEAADCSLWQRGIMNGKAA